MKHTHQKKHRHFVALPLLLAIIAGSGVSVSSQALPAGVLTTERSDSTVYSLASGVQVMGFRGAVVDTKAHTPRLREGSALVHGEGMVGISVRDTEIRSLSGDFFVSVSPKKLHVIAVTSPVLVTQGKRRVLIPTGKQWMFTGKTLSTTDAGFALWSSDRKVSDAPRHFLHEQLRNAAFFPPHSNVTLDEVSDGIDMPTVPEYLLLEGAKKREAEKLAKSHLSRIVRATSAEDADQIQRIFLDAAASEVLNDADSREVIATLMARSKQDSPVARALLSWLVLDADTWLIAAVHPQYSASAWTFAVPRLDFERQVLSWFSLPQSDVLPRGHNGLVIEKWKQSLADYAESQTSADDLLSALIVHTTPSVHLMRKMRYPLRADSYAKALTFLGENYGLSLSQAAHDALTSLESLDDFSSAPVEPSELAALLAESIQVEQQTEEPKREQQHAEPKKEQPLPDTGLTSAQVRQMAIDILQEAGMLFTVDTVIAPIDSRSVRIEEGIFSGPQRDRTFDFVLDVVQGKVSSVQEGKKTYPYALWVEDFVRWART